MKRTWIRSRSARCSFPTAVGAPIEFFREGNSGGRYVQLETSIATSGEEKSVDLLKTLDLVKARVSRLPMFCLELAMDWRMASV
jgi:hypothetical protein